MATTNVIAHKNLTDPQLHEPKGISLETTLSGQVYVANGSGSGAWMNLPFTAIDYTPVNVYPVVGYTTMQPIVQVDYTVLTPVTTGAVEDAGIAPEDPVDRTSINAAFATVNKNTKEAGVEINQLRNEVTKAFINTDALKTCLEELRNTLINSGIISGTTTTI